MSGSFLERDNKGKERKINEFISDLRVLIKTCRYCDQCEPGILRDRIILGISSDATREELLKTRKLNMTQCIDLCCASEAASSQTQVLKPDAVNKVMTRRREQKKKGKCRFCAQEHVFQKEKMPGLGTNL
jgi:hypothetical protein